MGLGFHSPDNLHILLASSKTANDKSANSGSLYFREASGSSSGIPHQGFWRRRASALQRLGCFLSRLQHRLVQPGSELMSNFL